MPKIQESEFIQIRRLIKEMVGIVLSDQKLDFVESRLNCRLYHLGLSTYSEYLEYLGDGKNGPPEISQFVSRVTTGETYFFREMNHFNFLKEKYIPQIYKSKGSPLRIWSAACSTGEEPYSLAFLLEDLQALKNFNYKILASDISMHALTVAQRGCFQKESVTKTVPLHYSLKYFNWKGPGAENFVEVMPEIMQRIVFKQINLLGGNFPLKEGLDLIFCRNVLIYFDTATRLNIIRAFHAHLHPEGLLFVGHSENLMALKDLFQLVEHGIYKKK